MELPYDVKDGKAEYNGKGRVDYLYLMSADGTTPSRAVELSEYPGFDPKSLTTTFKIEVNDTYFKVECFLTANSAVNA